MSDQAVKLAVSSRWDEAANANRDYIRAFGEDAEALNRLGKSLSELGQISEARSSYSRSLQLDPANTIARRMLDKLANMKDTISAGQPASQVDTRLFVEETGRATVATLQALEGELVLDAGDIVELRVEGNAVNVHGTNGAYIGMVEPRIGLRLSRMMTAGNQYSAAVVSASPGIRIMIREVFQHPSMVGRVSFPQARSTDFRGFTRRGLVRTDDVDVVDEDGDDDETDDWTDLDSDIDDDPGVTVHVDNDDESFD